MLVEAKEQIEKDMQKEEKEEKEEKKEGEEKEAQEEKGDEEEEEKEQEEEEYMRSDLLYSALFIDKLLSRRRRKSFSEESDFVKDFYEKQLPPQTDKGGHRQVFILVWVPFKSQKLNFGILQINIYMI